MTCCSHGLGNPCSFSGALIRFDFFSYPWGELEKNELREVIRALSCATVSEEVAATAWHRPHALAIPPRSQG